MAVFSVSRVESQIVSRFIFVLVRVNSWIVSAQKNTIHETTRNNTKRYEITPNEEAIVGIPNLDSKLGHYQVSSTDAVWANWEIPLACQTASVPSFKFRVSSLPVRV